MHSFTSTSAGTFDIISDTHSKLSILTIDNSKKQPRTLSFEPSAAKSQTCRKLFFKTRSLLPFKTSNTLFSTKTLNSLDRALQNSLSASTITGYSLSLTHFLNFCNEENVPPELCFPADEFVLCAF